MDSRSPAKAIIPMAVAREPALVLVHELEFEPVAARQTQKDQRTRREQVEGSLKEVEARRAKDAKVTLTTRLTQAGLDWEPRKFMIVSGILAAAAREMAETCTLVSIKCARMALGSI